MKPNYLINKPRQILFFLCLFLFSNAYSQQDTSFWFAAPEVLQNGTASNFDRPIILRLFAYSTAATVTIHQPAAGGMPTQIVVVPANSSVSVNLTTWINSIENTPANTTLNYGLKLSSTAPISAYYDVVSGAGGCLCNPEFFTLKGTKALGTDFWIPGQNSLDNGSYAPSPKNSFDIVATQNATTVIIIPASNIAGHLAGIPYTIVLNAGQSYCAEAVSTLGSGHLNGSRVTADKPIAVTVKDDLVYFATLANYGLDLIGDQILPTSAIGTEYIPMRGGLDGNGEQLYITATQNGTAISSNGTYVTTINAGQTYQMATSLPSYYVQTSHPSYIFQVGGLGVEIGGALLAPLNCTGSTSVSFIQSLDVNLVVNVLVKNGGQGSFLVNGSSGVITAPAFSAVPGTGGTWYAAQVNLPTGTYTAGSMVNITNTAGYLFHLDVINGNGYGAGISFATFNDFSSVVATPITTTPAICAGDSIKLFTDTITSASYLWSGPNGFSSTLQNPVLPFTSINDSGRYIVQVSLPGCIATDSLSILIKNPHVNLGPDTTLCSSSSLTLSSSYTYPTSATYLWSNGSGAPSISVASSGTYWLSVTDSGCTSTDTVHIAFSFATAIHRSTSTTLCLPGTTTLSGPTAHSNYHWSTGSTSSSISISGGGTYWVTSDSSCSFFTDTFHIHGIANPVVALGNDTAFCIGGTLHLNSIQPPGSTYLWSNGSTSGVLNISTSGTYWLAISDSGCSTSDTIHVLVSPYPIVNLGPDTSGCIGSPVILQSFGSYTTPQYLWSTGATTSTVSITTAGTYWLQITDGGCSGSDSISLDFFTPLIVDLGPDTALCNIANIVLSSVQPAGTNYLWNTGSTADSILVSTTGVYWLQVSNGCRVADTINIRVDQIPFAEILVSENVCIGDTIPIAIASHSANAFDYAWNFGGANIITHNSNHGGPYTASWTTTGIHIITLTAYSQLGCVGLPFSDTINVHSKPEAMIVATDISRLHCLDDSVLLTARNSSTENLYQWTPAHFFNAATGSEVWGQIERNGYVHLTVTNAFGCKASDSMLFNPDACCALEFPTAFTPNGDGKNDVFRPIKHGYHNFHSFRIYNRFGQIVYESSNSNIAWDGTLNGEPQDLGVFYYYAKYDCDGKTLIQKGDVTLVR